MKESRICVIYFAYINSNPLKDWRAILNGQMNDLVHSGLLSQSSFYIVLSGTPELTTQAQILLDSILINYPFKNFTIVHENHYEYEGIKKLFDLSQQFPEKIFLYFHSKGMVFYEIGQSRLWLEQMLTRITLTKWEDVLFIFNQYPDINKIGCYPANNEGYGCVWFNFYWVRGSYIQTCKVPEISNDRYYYENWLGAAGNRSINDSYSLINRGKRTFSRIDVLYSFVDMETNEKQYGYYNIPVLFDWQFYINKYPDLKQVFHSENDAKRHFHSFGVIENRVYCDLPNGFDWKEYLINNKDLLNNMICTKEDAIFHYITFGHKENRIFFELPADFDSEFYLQTYEDLRNAGLRTHNDAARHYHNFGKSENRIYKRA